MHWERIDPLCQIFPSYFLSLHFARDFLSFIFQSLINIYICEYICYFYELSSHRSLFHNILLLFSKWNSLESCTFAPLTSCLFYMIVKNDVIASNAVDKSSYKILVCPSEVNKCQQCISINSLNRKWHLLSDFT